MSEPKYQLGQMAAYVNGKLKFGWIPIVVYVTDRQYHTRVKLSQKEIKQAIIKLAESKRK